MVGDAARNCRSAEPRAIVGAGVAITPSHLQGSRRTASRRHGGIVDAELRRQVGDVSNLLRSTLFAVARIVVEKPERMKYRPLAVGPLNCYRLISAIALHSRHYRSSDGRQPRLLPKLLLIDNGPSIATGAGSATATATATAAAAAAAAAVFSRDEPLRGAAKAGQHAGSCYSRATQEMSCFHYVALVVAEILPQQR